jgi:hypothetical protein
MTVFTRDGGKLGKVVAVDDAGLYVEKGFFFAREYGFPYTDVEDVRDDGVHLRLDRTAISRAAVENRHGLSRNNPGRAGEPSMPAAAPAPPVTGGTGTAPHPHEHAEGRVIPYVGEGIAPMLVEDEVLVEEPDDESSPRAAKAPGRGDGGKHE